MKEVKRSPFKGPITSFWHVFEMLANFPDLQKKVSAFLHSFVTIALLLSWLNVKEQYKIYFFTMVNMRLTSGLFWGKTGRKIRWSTRTVESKWPQNVFWLLFDLILKTLGKIRAAPTFTRQHRFSPFEHQCCLTRCPVQPVQLPS